MEGFSESTPCLICYQLTARQIFVPADASGKILNNCKTYLHSTLTKETLKDVQLKNENQMPLCKSCFDSALEVTQLAEQLAVLQKEISDLTVTFSMAVFHRRSQVCNDGKQNSSHCTNKSSIIELNVSCLPSNTFWTKDESQNVQQLNDDNRNRMDNNIVVKCESNHAQFDNLTEYFHQENAASNDAEILLNEESQNENCKNHALENPSNLLSRSGMKIIQSNVEENEVDSSNSKNVRQLTMSDLMKSVKMPQVRLERINITGLKVNASSVNSSPKKSEPRPQLLNKIKCIDSQELKILEILKNFSNSNCASNDSVARKRLKCFYCERTFKRADHRNNHHRIHTGEKTHKCSFCTKGFAQISSLKSHERTHTREKHFECPLCKESFSTRTSQQIHERTHNNGEKPFKCSLCEKQFSRQNGLRKHERSTHTEEIPCNTSLCKEKFAQIGNRIIQEATRSGEKYFKCTFCEKRYATLVGMKNHEKYHAADRLFKCSFCEKRFCFKNVWQLHERTHRERPYECSFCKKRFSRLDGLKKHERIHTGEKPYKCSYCEKTFNKVGNKDRHQTIHRKNTLSLICSVCKQRFNSLDRLKDHKKTHEDELTILRILHEQIHVAENVNTEEGLIVGI